MRVDLAKDPMTHLELSLAGETLSFRDMSVISPGHAGRLPLPTRGSAPITVGALQYCIHHRPQAPRRCWRNSRPARRNSEAVALGTALATSPRIASISLRQAARCSTFACANAAKLPTIFLNSQRKFGERYHEGELFAESH